MEQESESEEDPEEDPIEDGVFNVEASQWSTLEKIPVTEMVDWRAPATNNKPIDKKEPSLGTNSPSKANESTSTIPRKVEPKLRLRNGKLHNIDLFWDAVPNKVLEELRERNE